MPQGSSPRLRVAAWTWLLVTVPAMAGSGVGAEFQVNTFTTNSQRVSSAAADSDGNFVVVWQSGGQDGSVEGVFGQRYDAAGNPLGSEFQVNSSTMDAQSLPSVASDSAGNFVVVWQDDALDGSDKGVFGQRYDTSGTPVGGEFQVNSYTTGLQDSPSVASDSAGNLFVAWRDGSQDGSGFGIFGQRYDATGGSLGGEFQINAYTTGAQLTPRVAADGAGNVVVIWQDDSRDGSDSGIFGRRYDAMGNPLGGEFQVNSHTTGPQRNASVASDSAGNFVVVWRSDVQDGSGRGVFGQRFDAAGGRLGSEFQVNSFTTGDQSRAGLALDDIGNFVVAWTSDLQDGSDNGVFGQRYDTVGNPVGEEFQVNVFTTDGQTGSSVTARGTGDFVVTWSSYLQDGSSDGVFGRLFSTIFADGFESGDAAAWDVVVP